MITSSVDKISLFVTKITFVVVGMIFKVTVVGSLGVKITFVVTEITFYGLTKDC